MSEIIVMKIDDWAVLYVNGINRLEHHQIEIRDLESHMPIETLKYEWVGETPLGEHVSYMGGFPETLYDAREILKGIDE